MNFRTSALSILALLTFAANTEPNQPQGLICTEYRSTGPITKAQFLHFKGEKLPEAEETIEFSFEECRQDIAREFAAGKTGKITKIVRLELKDSTGPVVAQFEFTRTSHTKAPLTISAVITIFGTRTECPHKIINLLKAALLNNSFLQSWGTTLAATAGALLVTGIAVKAHQARSTRIANERRTTTEKKTRETHTQTVFDLLKAKLQTNTQINDMYGVTGSEKDVILKKKSCTANQCSNNHSCNKAEHKIWILFGNESKKAKITQISINNELSMSYKLAEKNDLTKCSSPSTITRTDAQADATALEADIVKIIKKVFNCAGY